MMTSSSQNCRATCRAGRISFYLCILALLSAVPVEAREAGKDEARIAVCIRHVAKGSPWLEKTLWGLRDQEAGWIGAEVRNMNGSHDLGPFQINSWWVPKIAALVNRPQPHVRHWLRFDPCFNAGAARWIFLSALRETDNYWRAIGGYHSPAAWRQRRYALSVARHMQRRFAISVFAGSTMSVWSGARSVGSFGEEQSTPSAVKMQGFGLVQTSPRPH